MIDANSGLYISYINRKPVKAKVVWRNIFSRIKDRKAYENVTICDEWNDYQVFAKWFYSNYIDGYELDKDLLQPSVGNKIYSSNTCLFVPKTVNLFMANKKSKSKNTGVYRVGDTNKFRAIHYVDGKNESLGTFETIKEANIAYTNARFSKIDDMYKNNNIEYELYLLLIRWQKCISL